MTDPFSDILRDRVAAAAEELPGTFDGLLAAAEAEVVRLRAAGRRDLADPIARLLPLARARRAELLRERRMPGPEPLPVLVRLVAAIVWARIAPKVTA